MKVNFVDWKLHYKKYQEEVEHAIQYALARGDLIHREDHDEFEISFADFIETKYAKGVNSGTDAIYLSLWAAGIGKGDEVITVSHTFVATIAAIAQISATPVLVDVREDYLINPDKIEEVITDKTKAIIPVHYNGRMADMDKIMDIAKRHNLLVFEDSCQAMGVKDDKGRKAGSIGLTGNFSFYPSKPLPAIGDGGAITTNDDDIADKIHLLRDHGRITKTETTGLGINSRLDNVQAAVLRVKMKYLMDFRNRKRDIARIYNKALKDIPEIILIDDDAADNYVLRVEKRDRLFKYLKERRIETQIHEPEPNHFMKEVVQKARWKDLSFTEQLAKEIITLPMNPEISNKEVDYIIYSIKKFYNGF